MNTILIIEDDSALADGLVRALSSENINAQKCNCIKAAKNQLEQNIYSLILLDINLPDGNGFDFLKEIKEKYDTSVIILTANDMESDIVSGLELGADDYITKPFSLAILRARVNAQLRKGRWENQRNASTDIAYSVGDYIFDFRKMEFLCGGKAVELSRTEQKLLHILVENAGITLTRERLMDFVWNDGWEYVDENALSVAIKRLRDKLDAQDHIRTVYGIGYMWTLKS